VKYSRNGSSVEISSKVLKKSLDIFVKDEGIGIDKKDLPHVFDRFFRGDTARSKSDVDGFGLGLSIAKKIVEDHHGSISVQSTIDQGSTFIIHLPL
jgi:signal transduction histidine kinase